MNKTDCRSINDLVGGANRCKFLMENEQCLTSESVVNYMYMAFCLVDSTTYFKSIAISAILFLIFFISLGVTADDFLCPSLLVISKKLSISQNIAGVTLLAFGNGSPDIFSSLAGIKQTRPELVIGELLGAGIFVTMVVSGSVFLSSNFTSMKRPILRDMIFYLFAVYFVWATSYHGSISFWHASAFILIYIVYLITVILGRFVNQRLKKRENVSKVSAQVDESTNRLKHSKNYAQTTKIHRAIDANKIQSGSTSRADYNFNTDTPVQISDQLSSDLKSILISDSIDNKFGIDNPALDVNITGRRMSRSVHHHFDNTVYHIAHSMEQEDEAVCTIAGCNCSRTREQNAETKHENSNNNQHMTGSIASVLTGQSLTNSIPNLDSQSLVSSLSNFKDLNEIQDLLVHLCPLDFSEWRESSILSKAYQLIKAPSLFILIVTTPVIDFENDRDNWCRILNSTHLITSPITILYITGLYQHVFDSWLFLSFTVSACVFSSMFVYLVTSHESAPRFHYLYGFLGFVVSMLWIYALATETISLLHVIGIMFNLSDFILGLTILAFGNSIGDLMSNVSMARNGFARMGFSACYGGPLFNLLFGIGLPYCLLLYNDTSVQVPIDYSKIVTLSFGTASFGLLTTMFLLIKSDFKSKKWHGAILLLVYVFYVSTACLIELNYV